MDNPSPQLPQESLIAAVVDVWRAITPVLIVAGSCIPAGLISICAALLAIRASDIKKETEPFVLLFPLFGFIGMMAHIFALLFGSDPEYNRSAHKGWLVLCFQAYLGEIILHALAVGVVAVAANGWRAYETRMRTKKGVQNGVEKRSG